MASGINHVSRVRALYKAVLRLHRGLPLEMKSLGDQYVKSEFRLHKKASEREAEVFLSEWTKYYVMLAKQIGQRKHQVNVGVDLSPELLDNFQEEQVGQLTELLKETMKPTAEGS